MATSFYTNTEPSVNSCPGPEITPQPGEFVGALLARGFLPDAARAQAVQYREGVERARARHPVREFEPAARLAGYLAAARELRASNTLEVPHAIQ